MSEPQFKIETELSFYLSLLVKHLERNNLPMLVNIIHKSRCEVYPAYEYDNWNGGTYGHRITLYVDQDIFLDLVDSRASLEEQIKDHLNKLYTIDNEYIHDINLAPSSENDNLGIMPQSVFTNNKLPTVSENDLLRIWKNKEQLRVFISHRDSDKMEAANIQNQLKEVGISSFVAHNDIEISEEWAKEILRALQSMDLCLLYITDTFFDSLWTNQEVGFALGRNVPVIPLKSKLNPLGFVSILQAKPYKPTKFADFFVSVLLKKNNLPSMVTEKIINGLIDSLSNSQKWSISLEELSLRDLPFFGFHRRLQTCFK